MSNIITAPFIAKPLKASLTAAKFETIVNGKLAAFADTDRITPRQIAMDKASALAAMGGKASPVSFVNGLMFLSTAFAYGQGHTDTLAAGLSPVAVFALETACAYIKHGAGIDAKTLKNAVLVAMQKTAALPLKTKEAAPLNSPVNVIQGESRKVDEEPEAYVDRTAQAVRLQEDRHGALWAQYAADLLAGMNAAKSTQTAPNFVDLFATLEKSDHSQAVELLRKMAALAGFDLVDHVAAPAIAEPSAPVTVKRQRTKKAA